MHQDIVRKMNEIIGLLKVIEREISAYGSMYEKKNVVRSRTPDVIKKFDELNALITKLGVDPETNLFHAKITDEISRVLDVKDPNDFKYPH